MPVMMFAFQSGVLAALFPVVLWNSRGDTRLVVWRLSLLLCSYFYSAVCVLSAATATAKALLFFVVLNVAQGAYFLDVELDQIAGLMMIYLVPVVMAGVFGHALAEHRQINGAEKAALVAADKTLASANGRVAEDVPYSASAIVFSIVGMALFLGCFAAGTELWVQCSLHSVCIAAEFGLGWSVFFTISILLWLGVFVAMDPPAEAILGTGEVFGFWCLALIAVGGISFLLLGKVGLTVTLWIFLLGLTAFFGYCVRVYDSYVNIIRSHIPG